MNDAEVRLKVDVGDGGGILRIGNNIKQCQRQTDFLKTKIDDLKVGIQQMESMPAEFGKTQIVQAKSELEKLENQYNKLAPVSESTNTTINNGWKNGIKNAKRFVFNMFAVGSVFALVARAGRSYMDTNEDARASMEITSNVIGQLLAPAMKTLINLTQYAVIGIAELIRLFTGYDALAKVTTKNITKASQATKGLNKQLAGFDEITNIGGNDPLNFGLEADLQALDDFQNKIKEVRGWLEENKDWLEKVGITLLTVFGGVKLASILGGLASIIGVGGSGLVAGTGLVGIAGLLTLLATAWIITLVLKGNQETLEALQIVTDTTRGVTNSVINMIQTAEAKWSELSEKEKTTYLNSVTSMIDGNRDLINSLEDRRKKVGENTKDGQELKKQIEELITQNDLLKDSFQRLTGKEYEIKIEATVGTAKVQAFFDKLKSAFVGAGLVVATQQFPKFATGNVATKPTFGMFGEYAGAKSNPEITTPQKIMYDTVSQALSNNTGGSEVISKLDELIDTLERKDMNAYISERTIGNASTNWINQQKRIMGEDVI